MSTGLMRPPWLKGKYMLVRYEDLARNPMKKTEEIYGFLGIPFSSARVPWIQNNTRRPHPGQAQVWHGHRNSATAEKWRFRLSYDIVAFAQSRLSAELLGAAGLRWPARRSSRTPPWPGGGRDFALSRDRGSAGGGRGCDVGFDNMDRF